MRPWIKRTLFAVFGATLAIGGLTACGSRMGHGPWGHETSEADRAKQRDKMVDRVASKLELDTAQKAKLGTLADTLVAQRQQLRGATDPREEVKSLVAGPTFDRSKAQALADAKTRGLQQATPAVISAAADFYDSLKPEQQAQVREFMAARKGRWGQGG